MRDVVVNLVADDDVKPFFGEMMSGLAVRYDIGSDRDGVDRLIGDTPIPKGEVEVSLYDVMHGGMGVFLDAGGEDGNQDRRSRHAEGALRHRRGRAILPLRTDACFVWADEEQDCDGLQKALNRCFGPTMVDAHPVQFAAGR